MSNQEQLINEHIRAYESRLRHIDELYHRAEKATQHLGDNHETRSKLKDYDKLRAKLANKTESVKMLNPDRWKQETIQNSGPMAVWDVLAQQLESLIEKHEN